MMLAVKSATRTVERSADNLRRRTRDEVAGVAALLDQVDARGRQGLSCVSGELSQVPLLFANTIPANVSVRARISPSFDLSRVSSYISFSALTATSVPVAS
jgi:hypothetical protein